MSEKLYIKATNLPILGLFHLSVVYTLWSSTYLAIRVAVGEGGGFTPFVLGASRMFIASLILLLFSYLFKNKVLPSKKELYILTVSGTLLWVGGRGLIIWSEQYANSGFAALITATTPLWTVLFQSIFSKRKPSLLLSFSLLIGFIGSAILVVPTLLTGKDTDLSAVIALIFAAVCWSLGSIFQTRNSVNLCSTAESGWQNLIASCVFLILAILFEEPLPSPSINGWLAWAHLTLCCSVIAFTSYISALRLLPINIVMTSSFINPIIAISLGAWLLNEPITAWTLAGALLISISVIGIFQSQNRQKA